jgi:hypothetical protein
MPSYTDSEEIPLPLVRRAAFRAPIDRDDEDDGLRPELVSVTRRDRLSPGVSGGIAGFMAGLGALAVVHAMTMDTFLSPIAAAARARGVDFEVGLAVAYVTAAATGSLIGATFAIVTRYLRKWFPLLLWAVVFFVSLTLVCLAAWTAWGHAALRTISLSVSLPVLLAGAVFGMLVSFSLPIRRRH